MLLVELHGGLRPLVGVVLVLLVDLLDEGLEALDLRHALELLVHEGPEEEAHHQGQEEDGEAPVAGEAVGRLHDPEEAQGELAPEVGAEEAGEGEEAFHVEADELVLAAVDPEDFSRPKPHLPLSLIHI